MSRRKGGFFVGAAIGAVVAGVTALLFAPKAGEELREDIANKAKEVSKDLDNKIAKAKKDAEGLSGEARAKKLQSIEKAEALKASLMQKSHEFHKSGKKVTRVAAREADKMIQDGKVLIGQLDDHKTEVAKDTKKFVKKAGNASGRVVCAASKELQKDVKKQPQKPKK